MPPGPVHESAATGYQRNADAYVQARPSYHPDVVDRLVADLGTQVWLDVGAGTGIATRTLSERGIQVIAVEPVESMRAQLAASLPAVDVRDGRSDALPVPDASVDVVLAAQAFHWFDHGPTLDEIARVLQPGGALVTLWNVRDESVPWMAEWTRIVDEYAGDTPRWRTQKWRIALEADPRFDLVAEHQQPNPWRTNAEGVVARARSTSFIGALDSDTIDRVEAALRAAVAPLGDAFDFPYDTQAQVWGFA